MAIFTLMRCTFSCFLAPFLLEHLMKCKYCDFTCSYADNYKKHIKKEHKNKCNQCYIKLKDIEGKNVQIWDIHPKQWLELPSMLGGVINIPVV